MLHRESSFLSQLFEEEEGQAGFIIAGGVKSGFGLQEQHDKNVDYCHEEFFGTDNYPSPRFQRRSSLDISIAEILELTGESLLNDTDTHDTDNGTIPSSPDTTHTSTITRYDDSPISCCEYSGTVNARSNHFDQKNELSLDYDHKRCFSAQSMTDLELSSGLLHNQNIPGEIESHQDQNPPKMWNCTAEDNPPPPFHLSSPNFSPRIAKNYTKYLTQLIKLMNRSEQSRARVKRIKLLMKVKRLSNQNSRNDRIPPAHGTGKLKTPASRRTSFNQSYSSHFATLDGDGENDDPQYKNPCAPKNNFQTLTKSSFSLSRVVPKRRSSLELNTFQTTFFP